MKSSIEQLKNRGYISKKNLHEYACISDAEIKDLLMSKNAFERTAAAAICGERRNYSLLPLLCDSLKIEKKLYTKIAICEAIEAHGACAISYLLPLIGKIGTNQHKKIALVDMRKKSFPLPRDIVVRIIIRIGDESLPYLEDVLKNGNYEQKAEAIDAIGHIAFNCHDFRSESVLLDVYKNNNDELLQWKIIRAFQSFYSKEIISILTKLSDSDNLIFKEEAKRSLKQIERRSPQK